MIQGSLSIWYDTLLESTNVPQDLKRGDWIVINESGAYGRTAACNQFIGPSAIGEWMLKIDGSLANVSPANYKSYLEAT